MIFRAFVLAMMPMAAFAQDCDNAVTQMDMNQCAGQDLERADEALNTAWTDAMAAMRRIDDNLPADQQGAAQALRDAQRAWITVRDKGCAAESWANYGGSIRPLVELNCKTAATEARTEVLRALATPDQ